MVFILLNEKFEQIKIIDTYESMIWTDRYYSCGDFELYTSVDLDLLRLISSDKTYYVWSQISNSLMVIDQYKIESDFDSGSKMSITGRSAESLLDRRIIWGKFEYAETPLQDAIEQLLNYNVINPAEPTRKIPNFVFKKVDDPIINNLKITHTYSGENLYEALVDICEQYKIGMTVHLTLDDKLEFMLYSGRDRSFDQTDNPYVIFSPDFENLGSSNYAKSYTDYKNVAAISNGDGNPPTGYVEHNPNRYSGVDRREVVANSQYKSKDDALNPTVIEYAANEAYKEHKKEEMFEGQIESSILYIYGKDFYMGDIVQIRNEYHIESPSRVVEMVMNQDQDNYEMYPTFEAVNKE